MAVSTNICMYRLHELGDCFLLVFTAGEATSRVLIDCGSFRNSPTSIARLEKITADLRTRLNGAPIDVVVATHQHNDHVSGFIHCEDTFRDIVINQVWLSWLDDPRDRMARGIGEAHNNLRLRLAAARDRLHAALSRGLAVRKLDVLNDMLGFYGASEPGVPPELPANAIRLLKRLGKETPLYLRPGRTLDVPGLPADAVRVHVLGPPRDHDLLYRKDPRTGESYDHALAAACLRASKFFEAANRLNGGESAEEEDYPFNNTWKRRAKGKGSRALTGIVRRYNQPGEAWRKIDDDWLQQADALALYLDTFTNNSSLVLAIELVDSGKVLLFVADAQTGNWLSWKDVKWQRDDVSTDDLLAQTVFYKVGHHASHNATLVDAFEKMTHPDLVALIPVHKKDPNITKLNGWKMPARKLFRRIMEKTNCRVLQMDGVNPASCDPTKNPAKAAWKSVGITPRVTDISIEIDIAG